MSTVQKLYWIYILGALNYEWMWLVKNILLIWVDIFVLFQTECSCVEFEIFLSAPKNTFLRSIRFDFW